MALARKPATTKSAPVKVTQTAAAKAAVAAKPAPAPPPDPEPESQQPVTTQAMTAPVKTTALAPVATSSGIDLAADADEYRTEYRREDVATPFLAILQSNSPRVARGDAKYIEGAEAGMVVNTATKELWDGVDQGVVVIPAFYLRTFIEWHTREDGGGFVADHGLARGEELMRTTHKNEKKKDILPNGNQLVDTAQHFLIIHGEHPQAVVCAMTSSQLSKSKAWNTQKQAVLVPGTSKRAPDFAMSYRMRTVRQTNDQGSWYNWVIEPNGFTIEVLGEDWYLAAREFAHAARTGAVQVKHDASSELEGTDAANNDETPF